MGTRMLGSATIRKSSSRRGVVYDSKSRDELSSRATLQPLERSKIATWDSSMMAVAIRLTDTGFLRQTSPFQITCTFFSEFSLLSLYPSLLCYLEQFNLKLESCPWWNDFSTARISVRQIAGDNQSCLAPLLHEGKSLLPTLDHRAQRERNSLSTIDGRIEDCSVCESAVVMNFDCVGNGGLLAVSLLHRTIDHARVCLDGIVITFQEIRNKLLTVFLDTADNVSGSLL
mmetsp:Transcript_15527/g.26309  ORF Transcript_15527/g.26309 Transcript_15527/m.26309 type:complete len:229 (-) Transcript_15527:393-1079(-)